jgi:DnaK suppressor protein
MEKTIDLQLIREKLNEQRLELMRRIAKQAELLEPQPVIGSDRSALANRYVSQQRRSNALARAELKLKHVIAALQRLEQGNYGLCLSCGQAIQPGRLEALPHTELCVRCKEAREQRGITI